VSPGAVAAVDLGASSGRVVVGYVGEDELRLDEVHRFPNDQVGLPDGLLGRPLYHEALEGLVEPRAAGGLSGSAHLGRRLRAVGRRPAGDPYHYRDGRSAAESSGSRPLP
jgi:rhamnulokinase